jgi:choice-of-anchor B domain-containing protein
MNLKIFIAILFFAFTSLKAQMTFQSSNMTKIGFIDPETVKGPSDSIKYSGCWGWDQTSKNKEYAIVGSSTGTYFIDISAPATPTVCDYVAGKHPTPCIWREINVYQNYAYVVSDDGAPNSFQIIDMQYLPDSVHVVYDGKTTYFERAHTVTVDGNKLYVGGITLSGGGAINMRVYSLATPTAPVLLRTLSQDYPSINYVHDMHVRNDTVFASCGFQGLYVFKFNSSNTFSLLGSLTSYPQSGYNHSSFLTANGKNLIFTDEVPNNLAIKVADVSNLSNITVPALFRPNMNAGFVGHNPYVIGNKWVFVSCYEDGLYLYDISNPLAPVMNGFYDTFPQGGASAGNNYGSNSDNGNWGAYPFFKSGLILACDMQNGVFILGADAFKPVSNFSVASNICSGSITTFTDATTNNPTSWNWTMPGASPLTSTVQSPSVSYATTGIYSTTLITSNATGTNSVVKTITVNATPVLSPAGVSTLCAGASATLTVSGASSYTWMPGSMISSSIVVSPTTTTTYSVMGQSGSCIGNAQKTVSVICTVGIQPNTLEQGLDLKVYPNPTNGVVTISYKNNWMGFEIYNSLGSKISPPVKYNKNDAEVDLSNFSDGIYFVKVGTVSRKIIKN